MLVSRKDEMEALLEVCTVSKRGTDLDNWYEGLDKKTQEDFVDFVKLFSSWILSGKKITRVAFCKTLATRYNQHAVFRSNALKTWAEEHGIQLTRTGSTAP